LGRDVNWDKKAYHKICDMYSLGIILLEIAWWKPAEEALGFKPSVSDDQKEIVETAGNEDKPANKNQKKPYSKD
jgi:hypothetical protein